MAADAAGNVYVAGFGIPPDFPTTPGVAYPTPSSAPGLNSYVLKLNPQGKAVYCTYLPGYATDIAVDAAGNAHLVMNGHPYHTWIYIQYGEQQQSASVIGLDPVGARLIYSRNLGPVAPARIAVDGRGNIYIAGHARAGGISTTPGAFQPTLKTPSCENVSCPVDGFVKKLSPGASTVLFATYLGGSRQELVSGLAVDDAGNAYIGGTTQSPDFPTTAGSYLPHVGASTLTVFVAKLNPTGSALVYSTYLRPEAGGTILYDGLRSRGDLAVDRFGGVVVTGSLGPGGSLGTLVYIAKLRPDGASLAFSASFGVARTDLDRNAGLAVAADADGNTIVGGWANSNRIPIRNPVQAASVAPTGINCGYLTPPTNYYIPCTDGFIMKLDSRGEVIWSSYLANFRDDRVTAVRFDPAGNLYVAGEGLRDFLPPGSKGGDSFLARIEPVGPPPLAPAGAVVNSADFSNRVAEGGLATIFGSGLSSAEGVVAASEFPLPTELAGTSVSIGGKSAPLLAVANVGGREQINLQIPFYPDPFEPRPLSAMIWRNGMIGLVGFFGTEPCNGAVFLGSEGQPLIAHGADGALVTASSPARPGETVVIYATGLGEVDPPVAVGAAAPVSPLSQAKRATTARIGGVDAPVRFAGLTPGFAGLYQLNVVVPPLPKGLADVVLSGCWRSNQVKMAIE